VRPRETYEKVSLRPWGLWVLLPVCVVAVIVWLVGGRRGATPPPAENPAVETTTSPAFGDGPVPAASPSPVTTESGGGVEPPAAAPPAPDATPATPAAPRPVMAGTSIQLVFAEDSWINVADADHRLLYGLQRQGSRQDLKGRPPFHVMIGNAKGVKVSVDGQSVELPPSAIADNVARFDVPAPAGAGKPGADR
jgi:cytoskeleton protein RodZ